MDNVVNSTPIFSRCNLAIFSSDSFGNIQLFQSLLKFDLLNNLFFNLLILAFQTARAEAERLAPFTTNVECKYVPVTLPYTEPSNTNSRLFNFQVHGFLLGYVKENYPADKFDVLELLCGIRFVPTCSIGNGISWIELYVLFLVFTKQTLAQTKAPVGPSLCKRLSVFTSIVRSVISCFLMEDERIHFKPTLKRESRLQQIHRSVNKIRIEKAWMSKRVEMKTKLKRANSIPGER